MGEAGEEAVMPLHRGSDGSLGVRVEGGMGGGGDVSVVVNNYAGNSTASVQQRTTGNGLEIEVIIEEVVAKGIGDKGSNISKALNARNNQKMISR